MAAGLAEKPFLRRIYITKSLPMAWAVMSRRKTGTITVSRMTAPRQADPGGAPGDHYRLNALVIVVALAARPSLDRCRSCSVVASRE